MKCKCGHLMRSTTIYDTEYLRNKRNYPYTHSKHDKYGSCMVKGCKCVKPVPADTTEARK